MNHNNNDYSHFNKAELIIGGKEYFDLLLKLIKNAKENIHLQSYIFSDDYTGKIIADALKVAANKKVEVFLILDGIASQSLSHKFITSLQKEGANFKKFEPLFNCKHFYIGRRLHQKIVSIDNKYALVGGLNIANRYNDLPNKNAWLDFAVYVEGEIVDNITDYCWRVWKGYSYDDEKYNTINNLFDFNIPESNKCDIRIRRNDWLLHKNEISNSYIEMFHKAEKKITILSSYFIPGKAIRKLLSHAAKRGIQIRVITTKRSDVRITKFAEKWLYDWLLRKNIELYEYKTKILHGKMALCDTEWMTVGSYNVNNISTYASLEFNLDIRNQKLCEKANELLEEIIKNDCIKITKEYHHKTKNFIKQFLRWVSYQFIRIVFLMFTFYFKRKV